MSKKRLIKFLTENGGKPNDLTWYDLAVMFDIKIDGSKKQRETSANDVWRNYKKHNNVESVDNVIDRLEGFEVSTVWGKLDNPQVSYKRIKGVNDELNRELISELKSFSPKVPKITSKKSSSHILMLNIPDLHLGKEDLDVTKNKWFDSINFLLSEVSHKNITEIIFPIGNDYFHIDNHRQTTTSGTHLFSTVEWPELLKYGKKLAIETVLFLSKIAPVKVIMIPGNHDFYTVISLGEILESYFHNNKNVTVDNSTSSRKYIQFGKNLLGFEHGELKPDRLALLMPVEKPKDFANSETRIWFTGHLHHQKEYEFNGIQIKFLPALCDPDTWHKKMGFVGGARRAQAHLFNLNQYLGYFEYKHDN